jgi:hypothetical protein
MSVSVPVGMTACNCGRGCESWCVCECDTMSVSVPVGVTECDSEWRGLFSTEIKIVI